MLLKQFADLFFSKFLAASTYTTLTTTTAGTSYEATAYAGSSSLFSSIMLPTSTMYNIEDPASAYNTLNQIGICFGDGNTAVTINDYKLSGELLNDNLSLETDNVTYSPNGISYTVGIINNGEEAITISEIGLGACAASSNGGMVLLTRDVLDEPVTLEVGAGRIFTIYVDIQSIVEGERNL